MNISQLIMSIDIKLSQNKSSYSLGFKNNNQSIVSLFTSFSWDYLIFSILDKSLTYFIYRS